MQWARWLASRHLRMFIMASAAAAATAALAAMLALHWRRQRLAAATVAVLVDNGSLRATSFRNLRLVAQRLETVLAMHGPVVPVSFRFSDRIDSGELDGEAAELLRPALERLAAAGSRRIVVLPFFLGPSRTVTSEMVSVVREVMAMHPALRIVIAECLVDMSAPEDTRVAQALLDRVRERETHLPASDLPVVLVDHGSPSRSVNAVRNHLAAQLTNLLGRPVWAASMERRDGPQYEFNEPLLERVFAANSLRGDVIVALAFLSPGRHAGADGDIATILREQTLNIPQLQPHMTAVLGDHDCIIDVLRSRFSSALAALD